MKHIKVRQHKRRKKKSPGYSVIKKHYRKIKVRQPLIEILEKKPKQIEIPTFLIKSIRNEARIRGLTNSQYISKITSDYINLLRKKRNEIFRMPGLRKMPDIDLKFQDDFFMNALLDQKILPEDGKEEIIRQAIFYKFLGLVPKPKEVKRIIRAFDLPKVKPLIVRPTKDFKWVSIGSDKYVVPRDVIAKLESEGNINVRYVKTPYERQTDILETF